MLGGVSGHAGLFSTAEDLLAICQMLLDKGLYQGHRYLKAQTVETLPIIIFLKKAIAEGGWDLTNQPEEKCPVRAVPQLLLLAMVIADLPARLFG